jgi:glycosyltransferase involved in cell wall biosynthesis
MISIITPTHDTRWLKETEESLCVQSYSGPWEWVIVPNNGAEVDVNIDAKIVPYEGEQKIGAIKRFACEQAEGDIIVELDHDDLLTPNALELIADAFADGCDFAFSNFAEFYNEGGPNTFNPAYGWEFRERAFYGKQYLEILGFEPDPRSMSLVHYAPNHVRAWRKDTYWQIGGHDPEMKIADDHDLCCRFYLSGTMGHINDCLYLYRIHGDNSFLVNNAEIQDQTKEVRHKYLHQMIDRWAEMERLKKVDLGAAHGKPDGYLGVDLYGADICHNVTEGLPFENSSVGVIRAFDFLEHLSIPTIIPFMNEVYRVLIDGGWLISATPSTDGRGAFQDPTHTSFWNQNSFWYYTRHAQAKYVPEIKCRFQGMRIETRFPSGWHEQNNISYVCADLCAVKGSARRPGMIQI